jgi:hypothetical protein
MSNRISKLTSTLIATAVIFPTAIHADWNQAVHMVGSANTEQAYPIDNAGATMSQGLPAAAPLNLATWKNTAGDSVPGVNSCPDAAIGLREGANRSSGSVVVLDATRGACQRHFKLVPKYWRDWGVSSAPNDTHLCGFDLYTNTLLYRVPVTQIENISVRFDIGEPAHFCPGAKEGVEWNGPPYDPCATLMLIGEVEWCSMVPLQTDAQIRNVALGRPSSGTATISPCHTHGALDPSRLWAG